MSEPLEREREKSVELFLSEVRRFEGGSARVGIGLRKRMMDDWSGFRKFPRILQLKEWEVLGRMEMEAKEVCVR